MRKYVYLLLLFFLFKKKIQTCLCYRPVVFSWIDDGGPQSRVKLMGIFPGAKVASSIYRFHFDIVSLKFCFN